MDFDQLARKLEVSAAKLLIISETLTAQGFQVTDTELEGVAKLMKDRNNGNAKEMAIAWAAQQSGKQAREQNSTDIRIATVVRDAANKIVTSAQPLVNSAIDEATSTIVAQIAAGFYGGKGLDLPKTKAIMSAIDTFGQDFAAQNNQPPIDESVLMAQLKQSFITGGNPAFLLSASSPTTSNNQP